MRSRPQPSTLQTPSCRARRVRGLGRVPLAVAVTATALVGGTQHAAGAAPPDGGDRISRVCDPTLCYVVWGQIDSDGDGYNDADERVAGTDPLDPSSHPGPKDILALAIDRALPTFEAGMGAFAVLPGVIAELQGKGLGHDVTGALPPAGRASALERLGISASLLDQMGIPAAGGFTIGLGAPTPGGGTPPVRVGGMDMALIAAGDGGVAKGNGLVSHGGVVVFTPGETITNQPHGKEVSRSTGWFSGDVTITYEDGATTTAHDAGKGAWEITTKDADGNVREQRSEHAWDDPDGTHHEQNTSTTYDAEGNVTSVTEEDTVNHPGGSAGTLTQSTIYVRDDKGNVVGTKKVTTETWISGDGTSSTTAQEVATCDAEGDNCESETVVVDDDEEHHNPDADVFVLTDEIVDQVIRGRGAVVTPVQGAPNPVTDGATPADPNDNGPIVLVDDQTGMPTTLLEQPRVTTTQPDVRPDLPNPREALGSGPRRLCQPGC